MVLWVQEADAFKGQVGLYSEYIELSFLRGKCRAAFTSRVAWAC